MKVLITGGAGFIGSNAARHFIAAGHDVVVLDNLSRPGSEANLEWLRANGRFTFVLADIRDYAALAALFTSHRDVSAILHLAGQVAVTTSIVCPREDFDINLRGTFNILEALRERYGPSSQQVTLLYASTNKVYGAMDSFSVREVDGRYQYEHQTQGVGEDAMLDFHSPYGCSKGGADQYVLDYARIYGLKTISFRQSCIYGYRQFGIEDQGWVAWFTIAAALERPITIYGDGKQVRDLLFVDDLVSAYECAISRSERLRGRCFNIGGGPSNQLSLLELVEILGSLRGKKINCRFGDWRPGDQRVYVSDISRAAKELGWSPTISVKQGVAQLYQWVCANRALFNKPGHEMPMPKLQNTVTAT